MSGPHHFARCYDEDTAAVPIYPDYREVDAAYVKFAKGDGSLHCKDATRRCLLCCTGWITGRQSLHSHFSGSAHVRNHRKLRSLVQARGRSRLRASSLEVRIDDSLTFPTHRSMMRAKLSLSDQEDGADAEFLLDEAEALLLEFTRREVAALLDLAMFRASLGPEFESLSEWRSCRARGFDPTAWASGVRATNGSGALIPMIMQLIKD